MAVKSNEAALVKAVLGYLKLRGIFAWRCNSGMLRGAGGGPVRFGIPGMSDVLGILPGGKFLAIECKVGKNKPTKAQQAFLELVKGYGGVAFVAYSLDDVIEAIGARL